MRRAISLQKGLKILLLCTSRLFLKANSRLSSVHITARLSIVAFGLIWNLQSVIVYTCRRMYGPWSSNKGRITYQKVGKLVSSTAKKGKTTVVYTKAGQLLRDASISRSPHTERWTSNIELDTKMFTAPATPVKLNGQAVRTSLTSDCTRIYYEKTAEKRHKQIQKQRKQK